MACLQNSSMGVCIFAAFSTLDEFSSLFTRLNIAHDSYTFHETFIVPLHSFWNSISSVSVHTDHWKEWPVFLLLCSTEERESCRFEMVWERVRQSVCRIVCCPSARISIFWEADSSCPTIPKSVNASSHFLFSWSFSFEIWNRVIIVNKNNKKVYLK